jgi:hypothetical protein
MLLPLAQDKKDVVLEGGKKLLVSTTPQSVFDLSVNVSSQRYSRILK